MDSPFRLCFDTQMKEKRVDCPSLSWERRTRQDHVQGERGHSAKQELHCIVFGKDIVNAHQLGSPVCSGLLRLFPFWHRKPLSPRQTGRAGLPTTGDGPELAS